MACAPDKQALYEAIEACRPGRQDLSDPGLGFLAQVLATDPVVAARYAWSEAVDRQVAAAFADVAVPDGLELRILQNLQTALAGFQGAENIGEKGISLGEQVLGGAPQEGCGVGSVQGAGQRGEGVAEGMMPLPGGSGEAEGVWFGQTGEYTQNRGSEDRKYRQDTQPGQSTQNSSDRVAPIAPRKKSRRWLLLWGVGAGAAAAGILLLFWPRESLPPLSLAQIQAEALRFAMSESPELFGSGQPWVGQPGEGPWAFSRAIWVPGYPQNSAAIRLRKVCGLLGREGVAYDLRSAEGVCASLYVVPICQSGAIPLEKNLPVEPPRYEQTVRTGGYCAAAWQEDGYLYMLVVHGDSARCYYQFFRPQVVT